MTLKIYVSDIVVSAAEFARYLVLVAESCAYASQGRRKLGKPWRPEQWACLRFSV